MMYIALSYDHRIVDGREAVQFLVRVKELIEDRRRCCWRGEKRGVEKNGRGATCATAPRRWTVLSVPASGVMGRSIALARLAPQPFCLEALDLGKPLGAVDTARDE